MGWLFGYHQTRKDLIERLTTSEPHNGLACLAHAVRGNVLWTVWEKTPDDGGPQRRFIGCDLMASDKGSWGYKGLCESMELCYYTCPLKFLDMVPPTSEAWREQVRAHHAAMNRRFYPGDVVSFRGLSIPEATIVGKTGRSWIGEYRGIRYKLLPRLLKHVIEVRHLPHIAASLSHGVPEAGHA